MWAQLSVSDRRFLNKNHAGAAAQILALEVAREELEADTIELERRKEEEKLRMIEDVAARYCCTTGSKPQTLNPER